MKKMILYGNNDFAKLLKYYIETDTNKIISAITVEKKYMSSPIYEGLPVIPFEEIERRYPKDEYEILLGIGYSKMNTVREKIFKACKAKEYTIASYIHSTANIASNVQLGEGNIILENTLIQPYVKIGNGNLIWYNVAIAHDCLIGNFNTLTGMSSIAGITQIGNNCFLGNNSTIRDKTKIADYTLIGANGYINNNTEEYGVYVPQKSIKINKNSLDINI